MPKLIVVWVVGDAPQKGEAPSLWTAELQQAASEPVVRRQLSVWPWMQADGKWAKAVDIRGVAWQARAAGWWPHLAAPISRRRKRVESTKVSLGEEAYRRTPRGQRTKAAMGEEAFRPTYQGQRTQAVMGEDAYRQTSHGQRTKAVMGEDAYRQTSLGQCTMAVMGEDAYRQTSHGKTNATESARLLAARGAGETEDGLTEGEREALAARVAADVSGYVNRELTDDPNAVGYVAVGTRERMVSNLEASKANEWKHLGNCEIFGSLLRTNAAAFVIVEGTAQRFTTAFIRKVCAEPSLHPAPHGATIGKCRSSPCPLTPPDILYQGLEDGHIKTFVCPEHMDASYTAKVAEVNSHIATIRDWRHRMTMRGVSFGGPLQGHAGGHALGALVLCCGAVDKPRYLVPEVNLSPLLPTLVSTELYSLYSLLYSLYSIYSIYSIYSLYSRSRRRHCLRAPAPLS